MLMRNGATPWEDSGDGCSTPWEATGGSRASTTHFNLEAPSLPDDFRLVLPLPQDLTIEATEVEGKLWTKATTPASVDINSPQPVGDPV